MTLYRLSGGDGEFYVDEVDGFDEGDIQLVDIKKTKLGGRNGKDTLPPGIPSRKYFVTKSGDIWSNTGVTINNRKTLKKLLGHTDKDRYNLIRFSHDKNHIATFVLVRRHHAVFAAYGPDEKWVRLDHKDGDPQNNEIGNLIIATHESDARSKQIRGHTKTTSNRRNNLSGHEGLALHGKNEGDIGRWYVRIWIRNLPGKWPK